MIRSDKFLISQNPYAVNLASFRERWTTESSWYGSIDAVWFKRRKSATLAHVGQLRGVFSGKPQDGLQFVEWMADSRYGGECHGQWDGTKYWAPEGREPEVIQAHLDLLRPMLENYPAVPEGYDGWWRWHS